MSSKELYVNQFEKKFVAPVGPIIKPVGVSLDVLNDGTFPALLDWKNWNDQFSRLNIPGFKYEHCQMIDNYFWYAVREDVLNPRLTRSFCIISSWKIDDIARQKYSLGSKSDRVLVLYPPLDAINYNIGVRRREKNLSYYSRDTEENMAEQCALGDLLLGPYELKVNPGTTIYRCARMPGKIYDDSGDLIPSAATNVFLKLGFSPIQRSIQESESGMPLRIFGKTTELLVNGQSINISFSPALADELRPTWKNIIKMPQPEAIEPDPETY